MAEKKNTPKGGKAEDRIPQIVVTMKADLKKKVTEAAKAAKRPVTEIARQLFQDYVDGKITITMDQEGQPQATSTGAAQPEASSAAA